MDSALPDVDVRTAAFKIAPRLEIANAMEQVERLMRPPDDSYYQELHASYRRVRHFFPRFLRTITFAGSPAGQSVLDALTSLKEIANGGQPPSAKPPMDVVTPRWLRYVTRADGTVDRRAYTFCVLERLRVALSRRDVFVSPSVRYADPRLGLLQGAAWEAARPMICRSLGHPADAQEAVNLYVCSSCSRNRFTAFANSLSRRIGRWRHTSPTTPPCASNPVMAQIDWS